MQSYLNALNGSVSKYIKAVYSSNKKARKDAGTKLKEPFCLKILSKVHYKYSVTVFKVAAEGNTTN